MPLFIPFEAPLQLPPEIDRLVTPPGVVRPLGAMDLAPFHFNSSPMPTRGAPTPIRYREILEQEVVLQVQEGNGCGPTSLAMALDRLGVGVTSERLEKLTRYSSWIGTSPHHIRDAARTLGCEAVVLNQSSWKEIVTLLRSGASLVSLRGSDSSFHYEVVHGFRIRGSGVREVLVSDPNGAQYWTKFSDFSESWENLHWRGIQTGFDRTIIAVARKGSALPSERFESAASLASGGHGLVAALHRSGGEWLTGAAGISFWIGILLGTVSHSRFGMGFLSRIAAGMRSGLARLSELVRTPSASRWEGLRESVIADPSTINLSESSEMNPEGSAQDFPTPRRPRDQGSIEGMRDEGVDCRGRQTELSVA